MSALVVGYTRKRPMGVLGVGIQRKRPMAVLRVGFYCSGGRIPNVKVAFSFNNKYNRIG